MKQTIGIREFHSAFECAGRQDQFSYEARVQLFEYLDELDEDMELDVIAVCCEYSEDEPKEIAENYSIDISDCEDDDAIEETVLDYLNQHTCVVGQTSDGIVYQQF